MSNFIWKICAPEREPHREKKNKITRLPLLLREGCGGRVMSVKAAATAGFFVLG